MPVSLVLGLEHSCPWPRIFSLLGLEPCALDYTPVNFRPILEKINAIKTGIEISRAKTRL